MIKDTKIAAYTQAKIGQYTDTICRETSRPERKFVHDVLYGLLKAGLPQLGGIGRSLGESISVKKRTERLSRHLRKVGLWKKLMKGHLEAQKEKIRNCEYLLVDVTDISKEYATKFEGQGGVHDGSAQGRGYGYPIINIVGVGRDRSDVVLAYSELYSMKREVTSENIKILDAIEIVKPYVTEGTAFVMDRGGDRSRLFTAMLEKKISFIVRMNNNRHLWTEEGKEVTWKIAKYTKLPHHLKMLRQGKNRKKELHIICGARRVRLTKDGDLL